MPTIPSVIFCYRGYPNSETPSENGGNRDRQEIFLELDSDSDIGLFLPTLRLLRTYSRHIILFKNPLGAAYTTTHQGNIKSLRMMSTWRRWCAK